MLIGGGVLSDSEVWSFCIVEDGKLKINQGLKNSANVLKHYLEENRAIVPELSTSSISDELKLYGFNSKYKKLLTEEETCSFREIDKDFKVIETDTRLVVIDPNVAKNISYGACDWKELQNVSVQIAKYKLNELKTPLIKENIYYWNLAYDDFLGYMAGIIELQKYDNSVLIY